jgi:DNA repair exonuclease SbcCD ATPase subunit
VTNPTIAPPNEEAEPKIVSTADESTTDANQQQTTPATKSTSQKKPAPKAEMQDTINALSTQVERLSDKLTKMQENDKTLLDMERLTRAEQRAENLRMQLVDVEGKLADLQAKLEQLEYSLKPENIERATQGYGTTRPEEARDTRRRQLENDRTRTQAQIRILETSRQRLESSLVTADAEVDRLRRRLEMQEQQDATKSDDVPAVSEKP